MIDCEKIINFLKLGRINKNQYLHPLLCQGDKFNL